MFEKRVKYFREKLFGVRAQLTWDTLIPWIIAIAVLAFVVILYITLGGKTEGAIAYIKNFVRFGRG